MGLDLLDALWVSDLAFHQSYWCFYIAVFAATGYAPRGRPGSAAAWPRAHHCGACSASRGWACWRS